MPGFKNQFNAYVAQHYPQKVDEIKLFDALIHIYGQSQNTVAIKRIHGGYNSVEFFSPLSGKVIRKELGDLLFVVFDRSKNEIRICTMQNKYRKDPFPKKIFSCPKMDVGQWELLKSKSAINSVGSIRFPPNILNFRADYQSISAYGIFYKDKKNDFDFLYTTPDYLYHPNLIDIPAPKNLKRGFRFAINSKSRSGFDPSLVGVGIDKVLFCCTFNNFDWSLRVGKIGAPISDLDLEIRGAIYGFLQNARNNNSTLEVIGDIEIIGDVLRAIESQMDRNQLEPPISLSFGESPNMIIIETSPNSACDFQNLDELHTFYPNPDSIMRFYE